MGVLNHLCNSSCVVADWAVGINGKSDGKGWEHSEGWQGNSEHSQHIEGDKSCEGQKGDGHKGGQISESNSIDNVGGCASAARICDFSDWSVRVRGVVFSDKANEQSGN